ncbi:MAG: hypothetical protein WAL72_03645 [Streptosporangiaceae bacterium]
MRIAGVPEAGVLAAAGLGLDAERTLLVPDPGHAWPQVEAPSPHPRSRY